MKMLEFASISAQILSAFAANTVGLQAYSIYKIRTLEHYPAGADCKDSNTRIFQGQSFEGGTFEGQLVPWSVKIVQELPSFSL